MIQSQVPEISIKVAGSQMLEDIKASIVRCCASKGFAAGDVDQIVEFKNDLVVLHLNYLEGVMLFAGDELLEKELGLFAANTSHTKAHLKELNEQNAALGVSISRVPALDDEFRDIVAQAENNITNKVGYVPKVPDGFEDAFANNAVIAVGEMHSEEAGRLTIANKLPALGAQKGALAVEHLFANRQNLMDDWLAAPRGTRMPPLLVLTANAIAGADADYYGSMRLIEDAKNAGVRVLGFESDATLMNNYNTIALNSSDAVKMGGSVEYPRSAWDYRALTMNEAAREVIAARMQEHGKIVVNGPLADETQHPEQLRISKYLVWRFVS